MGLRRWPVWLPLLLLGSASFLLGGCAGSSSHSLHYFYMRVSEPGQGLPQFTAQASVDDHIFIQYDSDRKRALPQVPWVQKVGQDYPHYWDNMTQIFRDAEEVFRVVLESVQRDHEQSTGLHTWQVRYGCELSQEGRQGAYEQEAYDGTVYLDLDLESLSWMAVERGAQVSRTGNQTVSVMAYVGKEDCIAWLRRYLDYGKEVLLRTGGCLHEGRCREMGARLVMGWVCVQKFLHILPRTFEEDTTCLPLRMPLVSSESPVVKVTSKEDSKGPATLVCRVYGFYPKEINAYWKKDGEVWVQDTFRGVATPNSDGTYHAMLGIQTNPEERKRFQCHVEHEALPKHLDVAWQEPAFNSGLLIICIVGAVVLVAGISVGISKYHVPSKCPNFLRTVPELRKPTQLVLTGSQNVPISPAGAAATKLG
ncbi:major histocompatibility complex class I-related gene protein [Zootoca vivipara]|uniref:major histocompatibility complex class I-related gene protein n=1 Tax=Zootoca vivipara TaxID=8524 RepID=UPI00293B8819|nr:major histocompatibility complex class I-related gene protein [Zootoca vivipara]